MNEKTPGKAKASVKPARPKRSPYAPPKPPGRDTREVKAEFAGRREQQSTDRSAHKANLNALHKIALEALRPLAAQVQLLHQEAAAKDAEIMDLRKRVTRLEAGFRNPAATSGTISAVPPPPPPSLTKGKPRRQPATGKPAGETTEDRPISA